MGEFELIRRLAETLGAPGTGVPVGIGDDAAVLDPDLVWTCDVLVEDVHFRRRTHAFEDIGWKALAVNVSDVAAMGAEPIAALVGLVLPGDVDDDDAVRIYAGLAEAARSLDCPVVGGDVTAGPVLTVAVTALGRTRRPVLRSGARPGDVLAVTGRLGGSGAGRLVLDGAVPRPLAASALAARHRRPYPRVREALALAPSAHALMDVSDGVASDAMRLAEASDVAIRIDLDLLPLDGGVAEVAAAAGMAPTALAATGGEDFELLVALAPEDLAASGVELTVIGTVEQGGASVSFAGVAAASELRGWDHRARPG